MFKIGSVLPDVSKICKICFLPKIRKRFKENVWELLALVFKVFLSL
jgi:hypothetical protein